MRKWWVVLGGVFGLVWQSQAQVLTPLTEQPARLSAVPITKPTTGPQPLAPGDTLALPFFDDFAKGEGGPDAARWLSSGGVWVSDRYASNPPTVFAATFDGLQANGQQYNTIASSVGPTDTLTSKPLQLGSLQPQDSVYLSFFWQAGGLVDAPNFSSAGLFYLNLEFKAQDGSWQTVWNQNGSGRSTDFASAMVALKDSRYLYDGFQFRWVSSGSQNGIRDVWHIDYVWLDKNRRLNELHSLDVAFTKRLPSLLSRYTAMPIWQFLENPQQEVRTSLGAEFVNLSAVPAAVSWRGFVRNLTTAGVDTFLSNSAPLNADIRQTVGALPSISFLTGQSSGQTFQTTLFLNTKEPNFYTRYNDTLTRETDIQDYYAYDDGSAETGFSFPSSNAVQIAYQFELNKGDRIKAVRLYFTGTNTPNTALTLRIWADQNGLPAEQAVYEQAFTVPTAGNLNNWLEIPLTQALEVQGKFYVGYRQPAGTAFVNLGFDVNESAEGKMFSMNGVTNWEPIANLGGALLMRPVMSGLISAAPEEILTKSGPFLYPNPSTGEVTFQKRFERVEFYSLTGQKMHMLENVRDGQMINLNGLATGLYLVKALNGNQLSVTKLILTK